MSFYPPGEGDGDFDGGASQYQGDGFERSPMPGSQAPQGSPKKKGDFQNQTLLAVTVKQLKQVRAEKTEKPKLDGKDLGQVTFIGNVVQVELQTTGIVFTMDDGTGIIPVRKFLPNEERDMILQTRAAEWKENAILRVVGNVKASSGDLTVMAFDLLPIKDPNEITFHMLEVIHSHLLNTKGAIRDGHGGGGGGGGVGGGGGGGGGVGGGGGQQQQQQHQQQQRQQQQQPHQQHQQPQAHNVDAYGASPIQAALLHLFREDDNDQSDTGLGVEYLISKLPQFTPDQVKHEVEFLANEGHLYVTMDEFHFKLTRTD